VQSLVRRLLFQYWYFGQPPWDTGVSPPELLEFLQTHEPGRAIDLGCGTGTNVITLAKAGWRVMGVDFAPRAIKLAKQKVNKEGVQVELFVKDVTNLRGINGPFDLAFDLGCFHSIPQNGRIDYIQQLNRILAPDGFWLMYGFLKPETNHAGPGLVEADISHALSYLTLVSRKDGFDDSRARASAWFLFQKQK
jgi:cyclopropane fatty-acyl-phospholipid synthase-like methyltransferase